MKIIRFRIVLFVISMLLSVCAATAQTGNASGKIDKPLKDRALKIKSRILPNENILVECGIFPAPTQLFIGVLATFDKSGKVTGAELEFGSGCKKFDEECLKVAKRIKFKPAVKNGVPVTIVERVIYNVSVGTIWKQRF